MVIFIFTIEARKQFFAFPKNIQLRISRKLQELKKHIDIFALLKGLEDIPPSTHRLRIGSYRLLLVLKSNNDKNTVFWVLKIAHRRDIYR